MERRKEYDVGRDGKWEPAYKPCDLDADEIYWIEKLKLPFRGHNTWPWWRTRCRS